MVATSSHRSVSNFQTKKKQITSVEFIGGTGVYFIIKNRSGILIHSGSVPIPVTLVKYGFLVFFLCVFLEAQTLKPEDIGGEVAVERSAENGLASMMIGSCVRHCACRGGW